MSVGLSTSFDTATARRRTGYEALELLTGWAMLEAALWTLGGAQVVLGLAALAVMAAFNYVNGYTRYEQGFSPAANRRALWLIPTAVCVGGAMILIGVLAGTVHPLIGVHAPAVHILGYAIWAFVQEWMALGFVLGRLERMLSARYAVLGCAAIFCLAHVPNLVLMIATFVMSAVFAVLFRRYRALYPIAVAHALLGLSLAIALPGPATHFMRVGAAYFR
jgi:membrane protease YdiL (CAAX protease family)